jgi:CTP:molybdopterin cytidylyltransferase MocA
MTDDGYGEVRALRSVSTGLFEITPVDFGTGRSAEVEVYSPDHDSPVMVVLHADEWPMTPDAARQLADAVRTAADRAEVSQ